MDVETHTDTTAITRDVPPAMITAKGGITLPQMGAQETADE